MGLAAAADIVIATPKAHFRLTETSLGLPPAQIAPYLVSRLGERVARRLALTGARLDGAQAAAVGLVDVFCETESQLARSTRNAADVHRALRAGRQRRDQAAVSRLPRRSAGRLYRDGRQELCGGLARARGQGRRGRLPREARAVLGEATRHERALRIASRRQSRRDRLPHHSRRTRGRFARHRRLQRRR